MVASQDPVAGLHLVRYGIPADHKFLLGEFLKTYDQLVFNATIVASMPAAIASFLTHRATRKPYFIDPQTHAFQHDVSHIETTSEQGGIKRSIRALLDSYGEPVEKQVGKRMAAILPRDFANRKVRVGFCERVLRFQAEAISAVIEKSDAAKYYRFLAQRDKGGAGGFEPSLIVAPYFFMTGNTFDAWLQVNLKCFEDSLPHASQLGRPLGVQIVVSRDVLTDGKLRARLLDDYTSGNEPAAFLIWVDAFAEQKASRSELEALIELMEGLGQRAPVVNLYGGFFSAALARSGVVKRLRGVTHGLEYGEDRPVVPVGGGIPTAKFYLPNLHARLSFRDAIRAIRRLNGFASSKDFHEKICDCKECKVVIASNPEHDFAKYGLSRPVSFVRKGQAVVREFPTPETRQRSVRHYMWCKEREYRGQFSVDSVVQGLRRTSDVLGRVLGLENTAHCDTWAQVLSSHKR